MDHKRNIYLNMKTIEEARKVLFKHFSLEAVLGSEKIAVPDSVGRVLSKPVFARLSSPAYHLSAMDGVAVMAQDTFGAGETSPKELVIGENAIFVNTGHLLPKNTDSVIMIENIQEKDQGLISIEAPAFPWQNVRKVGEDIVATELLFPMNHSITPYCIGALLSAGIRSVEVKKKPRAAILPTGSELVDWMSSKCEDPGPGQVIESNSYVLGSLIKSLGGEPIRLEPVKDSPEKIKNRILEAVNGDFEFVMINGGSSAGSEDYAKKVIRELGEVLVHGVTMMPGKPLLIGDVSGKPVFGVPGYQVSAIMAFEQFISPMISKMLGQPEIYRRKAMVKTTRKLASRLGLEEFLRVKIGKVGETLTATPMPRAAGAITTLTEADGIIRIPNHVEGLKENALVEAELLRPLSVVENTIVAVGSHDNTLDVLANRIKAVNTGVRLASSHVGSMGGLMAVKKGVCHVAGTHLLDLEDGSYNVSYVRKYLGGMDVKLVNLVMRDQGLVIQRGNPKNIKGIMDLTREDIGFVNRQPGSGTRILLDFKLREMGIDPVSINGYGNEEFTHMSVAVSVLSGAADAGLGIFAAAKALNLDFIPIVIEQYDLLIPACYFESKKIQLLLEIINTSDFKNACQALGGYSTEKTGQSLI